MMAGTVSMIQPTINRRMVTSSQNITVLFAAPIRAFAILAVTFSRVSTYAKAVAEQTINIIWQVVLIAPLMMSFSTAKSSS